MRKIIILGAGTAGTIMANKLCKALDREEWSITIIDREKEHYYQPGFLFIPFGIYGKHDVIKAKSDFFPVGVNVIYQEIEKIDAAENHVFLTDGKILEYDFLIVASGAQIKPEETTGLKDKLWYKQIFDFYTIEGALALYDFFKTWEGGRLVMAITEIPFKCPVAPIEFVCLAEAFFTQKGIRDKVDLAFVTPLAGAFTKPVATRMLGDMLNKKNIKIVPDFYIERIDNENKKLISYDEKEIPFDVLTIVPVNKGADFIGNSGLGDELNFLPVNKGTLQHEKYPDIYALGDAAALPTSKAGSVAHFAADILFDNLINTIENRPIKAAFDGHSNCFVETGYGKGTLVDFNYDTEPLPGTYPLPVIGPFSLLKNTRLNHLGKLIFRWIYWHILLKGRHLPVSVKMKMSGKRIVKS